jgi:hypothetical protein
MGQIRHARLRYVSASYNISALSHPEQKATRKTNRNPFPTLIGRNIHELRDWPEAFA